ncbi:hypothetical protein ISN45_Aa01g038470 [Arabidopsis thaliana x Arabidopsis arenosa]|uniref:Uncharacterized protein n=1 Tax=Arabidopsis thaliana x Arabidopsis arenosa TaxID=1240361 RepID=A0A8T2CBL2_9BRAS|nr:hypothetical protein ISN45_Aa01g038470 [Arabidopsis thaliana x Arabidopsis arenosa]
MKFDDNYKLIVIVIGGVLAGFAVVMFSCCKNKRKNLQLPELTQTPEWQRQIVSAPTLQTRSIDVGNDRLWGRSDTVVKKCIIPLKPNAVDDSLRYQGPKNLERPRGQRDDGTAASTSAFGGGCVGTSGGDNGFGGTSGGGDNGFGGGSHSGGDNGCGGSHSGGGGCGDGGGGGGCGGS